MRVVHAFCIVVRVATIPAYLLIAGSVIGQDKTPIPSDAAQAKALALVREVHGDEWTTARTTEQKIALAKKLLTNADEAADAANRYALLKAARDVSAQAGEEAYYREPAKRYKERVTVPLILVGGIRSYTVAERLIEDGVADFISLSRPLIREPHLIARWKSGDREKSPCQSCNLCFKPIRDGKGVYCVVEAREREKEAAGK